ncbi:hypothetical protein AVEN_220832-1 [Araneus ventricosus]|uniref:Uncharacterized protein n=1 Tax=Araneus ventricosus TaxID=182803 RepID=A0A4Y2FUI4_ARAVE|nr:hypothetical protein AVEN_220832-1 [Araneus ventricosus]
MSRSVGGKFIYSCSLRYPYRKKSIGVIYQNRLYQGLNRVTLIITTLLKVSTKVTCFPPPNFKTTPVIVIKVVSRYNEMTTPYAMRLLTELPRGKLRN